MIVYNYKNHVNVFPNCVGLLAYFMKGPMEFDKSGFILYNISVDIVNH